MFIWVANFWGLIPGFARLLTLLRTFIVGSICLTKNKIWVFHPKGGICPILLHPNTRDLYLLLFYTTVSLDFGRCPISELTPLIHQEWRIINIMHIPDLTQCYRAYEMHLCSFMLYHVSCTIKATCNISKT